MSKGRDKLCVEEREFVTTRHKIIYDMPNSKQFAIKTSY